MIMRKLSKKDKIELTITLILIVILIMFSVALSRRKRASQSPSRRIAQRIFSAVRNFKHDPQRNKGTPFIWEKRTGEIIEVKRNPFFFGSSNNNQGVSVSDLLLKGIIWDPDKPSAIINERVVGIGDVIVDFKVTQITQDSVILENEKSKLELKLN